MYIDGVSLHFQKTAPALMKRLSEIIKRGTDHRRKILVALNRPDNPFMIRRYLDHWRTIAPLFNRVCTYGCATITWMINACNIGEYKKIWEGRKVVFIVSSRGRFEFDVRLFGNIAKAEFIDIPPENAFSRYAAILAAAKKYTKDWMFFISAGPTAKPLAYDLAMLGYQALDMGHLTSRHRVSLGEEESATPHIRNKKDFKQFVK
jgi:hypothetical protein